METKRKLPYEVNWFAVLKASGAISAEKFISPDQYDMIRAASAALSQSLQTTWDCSQNDIIKAIKAVDSLSESGKRSFKCATCGDTVYLPDGFCCVECF